MSETTKTNEQEKRSWLARLIHATARATADALYERLREAQGADGAGPNPSGCGARGEGDGEDTRRAEELAHLLRVYDGLNQLLDHYESSIGPSKRRRRRRRPEIRLVVTLIDRVLARLKELGVNPIPFLERIDYRLHEPVRVTATHQHADDGRVLDVYLSGFASDDHVIRPAKVSVLKYCRS